jgi:hypothetical protein
LPEGAQHPVGKSAEKDVQCCGSDHPLKGDDDQTFHSDILPDYFRHDHRFRLYSMLSVCCTDDPDHLARTLSIIGGDERIRALLQDN